MKGNYQKAYVTYEPDTDMTVFNNLKSVFMYRDCVRIYRLNLSQEDIINRDTFSLKLSGLPPNTLAYDIIELLNQTNAKACFISRHPKNYKPVPHAYIYFNNQEDCDKAGATTFEYRNKQLCWVLPDMQTCHKCGEPNHIAKNCSMTFDSCNKITPN